MHVRHVRLADGPDIVHLRLVAKEELKRPVSVEHASTLIAFIFPYFAYSNPPLDSI